MRPGPPRGATTTIEVVVAPEQCTRVDGRADLSLYSTTALAADIERVCRLVLQPHLEAGETGIAAHLDLLHRAPVPCGSTVTLQATVAAVGNSLLTCEVLVRHGGTIVARGSLEQRIVALDRLGSEVAARRDATSVTG